jgi:hypothetical protein
MADKTPAEKLRLKAGMTAALLHVPEDVRGGLGLPDGVAVDDDPAHVDVILDFAATQAEAERRLTALEPHVRDEVVLWFCYPKGSKAAGHDLNRDTVATFARTVGLVAVSNVAVDETWSALRIRRLRAGDR